MLHSANREKVMKTWAVLCAAMVGASGMATELVSYQGKNVIHLADGACTSETVLKRLGPEMQGQFMAASAELDGESFKACWRATPVGAHLIYEDGDQGLVPLERIKPLVSI